MGRTAVGVALWLQNVAINHVFVMLILIAKVSVASPLLPLQTPLLSRLLLRLCCSLRVCEGLQSWEPGRTDQLQCWPATAVVAVQLPAAMQPDQTATQQADVLQLLQASEQHLQTAAERQRDLFQPGLSLLLQGQQTGLQVLVQLLRQRGSVVRLLLALRD